jgi:hypothetical protein
MWALLLAHAAVMHMKPMLTLVVGQYSPTQLLIINAEGYLSSNTSKI